MTLLSACGAATSSVDIGCPPLREYSALEQKTVAQEMEVVKGQGKLWPHWILDYGRLRAMCR